MKRIALVLLLMASAACWALDVVTGELESAKNSKVVFVSYEGPPAKVESLAAIKGIGSALGAAARSGSLRAGAEARYAVIRVVDPTVKTGFDADIIVLGSDAQVDHIRNLRWIIAAYLSSAWGYSDADASLLATFVTVYNAVHRGDMGYIGSRYKPAVARELSPENAGLSTRYSDWPGKTRILIPLTEGATPGSLGAVS
ncbi:MAG TPA: P83/100 family protein, partial [Rectinemataceae bacterium]|nr:P83/100 family protein [Rectinemataceae bacterium]